MEETVKVNILMVGAGEYNTGCVNTTVGAAADKRAGVVGLVLFDLRRLNRINRILLCDIDGLKLREACQCMKENIEMKFRDMDSTVECFPADFSPTAPDCYKNAMDSLNPGDAVIIFTPDDTHFAIASYAISKSLHVLCAKPLVKTLDDHQALEALAKEKNVIVAVEYHKRWDPIYNDARERARRLGPFSYFYSCMTQRKNQLNTFSSWAGKSSDISYYLNSHHIDLHCWFLEGTSSRPVQVTAGSSTGFANRKLEREGVEDTISILVSWENSFSTTSTSSAPALSLSCSGHAVYMSSWIAPTADCHTQQYFHYMGQLGELRVDQAHRGYSVSTDGESAVNGDMNSGGVQQTMQPECALTTVNPLYMRYVPDARGYFCGQNGYGYRSIEAFIESVQDVRTGRSNVREVQESGGLATVGNTKYITAILQAGRMSLDSGGRPVRIHHKNDETIALELL